MNQLSTASIEKKEPLNGFSINDFLNELKKLYRTDLCIEIQEKFDIPVYKDIYMYSMTRVIEEFLDKYLSFFETKEKVIKTEYGKRRISFVHEYVSWNDQLESIMEQIIEAHTGINITWKTQLDVIKQFPNPLKLPDLNEVVIHLSNKVDRYIHHKKVFRPLYQDWGKESCECIETYMNLESTSEEERIILSRCLKYITLTTYSFHDLHKRWGTFKGEASQVEIVSFLKPVFAFMNSIIDMGGITEWIVRISELIKLWLLEERDNLFGKYEIANKYKTLDEWKYRRIKNSYLDREYYDSIENTTLREIVGNNWDYFLHKSKVPYMLTFQLLQAQQENTQFLQHAKDIFMLSRKHHFSFKDSQIRDCLIFALEHWDEYQNNQISGVLHLLRIGTPLDELFKLSLPHLQKIGNVLPFHRETIVGLLQNPAYLENEWKAKIQSEYAHISPDSQEGIALAEILASDKSIDKLNEALLHLTLDYDIEKMFEPESPPTQISPEVLHPKMDVEVYLSHYFGTEWWELINEYLHHHRNDYSEDIVWKIKELGEKVDENFREDFLLEFVSGKILNTQIDFYLACIHACKYYHIKILSLVELTQVTPLQIETLGTVTEAFNQLQISPLNHSQDIKEAIENIINHGSEKRKPSKDSKVSYEAHNIFDQGILEILKTNDTEKLKTKAAQIDRLLGNLLNQFHPSLTTSTLHGKFGTGSGSMTKIIRSHLLSKLKKKSNETDKVYLKRISSLAFKKYLGNILAKDIKNQPDLGLLLSGCETQQQEMMFFEYLQTITQIIKNIELIHKNKLDLWALAEYYEEMLDNELGKIRVE